MIHAAMLEYPAGSSDCSFEEPGIGGYSFGLSGSGDDEELQSPGRVSSVSARSSPALMTQSRVVVREHVNQNVVQGPRLAATTGPSNGTFIFTGPSIGI